MLKKPKIKILILLISTIIISGYLLISIIIENDKFKKKFKKYIFPYKLISQQQQTISKLQQKIYLVKRLGLEFRDHDLIKKELNFKESGRDIEIIKIKDTKLSNNFTLKRYELTSGFYSGIWNALPGSGYIDFHEDNILIVSSKGVLAFKSSIKDVKENFKQIKNNINDFIGMKQFVETRKKLRKFSIKDMLIVNDKIFISFVDEIKKDCWNTSIIYADLDYKNIKFEKLFTPKNCIHSIDNIDKEFTAGQSGGRIVSFDDKNILFSIGDYRNRHLAQDIKSVNGKIIKINIDNNDYEIISMGHRNPQGLYFDKENNFILETEHGPQGGDEINLIDVYQISDEKIQNFGWAISSAGEHYGGKVEKNKQKYQKYPLYKSHTEHGFIEPLKSFVPSIGISNIIKIFQNKYVVSSMKDKSLYFLELNDQKQIINLNRVKVGERIRDLRLNNNQLYLFMENTASIGVINLN